MCSLPSSSSSSSPSCHRQLPLPNQSSTSLVSFFDHRPIPRAPNLPRSKIKINSSRPSGGGARHHIRLHSQLHAIPPDHNACTASAQDSNFPADGDEAISPAKVLNQLKRYGVAGILSYGILNTLYYSTAFLLVWFYFSPPPAKMGYMAAVGRFLQVMAMVWAGSQLTKLFRAAGALALAPFVDRGLSRFTESFAFESRGKAFLAIVGFCLGLALVLFLTVTLLAA